MICNFTLAQAQDNNEKDLKNTIVLANKDKDVENMKPINYYLWKQKMMILPFYFRFS